MESKYSKMGRGRSQNGRITSSGRDAIENPDKFLKGAHNLMELFVSKSKDYKLMSDMATDLRNIGISNFHLGRSKSADDSFSHEPEKLSVMS